MGAYHQGPRLGSDRRARSHRSPVSFSPISPRKTRSSRRLRTAEQREGRYRYRHGRSAALGAALTAPARPRSCIPTATAALPQLRAAAVGTPPRSRRAPAAPTCPHGRSPLPAPRSPPPPRRSPLTAEAPAASRPSRRRLRAPLAAAGPRARDRGTPWRSPALGRGGGQAGNFAPPPPPPLSGAAWRTPPASAAPRRSPEGGCCQPAHVAAVGGGERLSAGRGAI